MGRRILVAMSGGVDSAVAAALLREQGVGVEGVTMKLAPGLCCDIGSAQVVCHHLGIPHRMIDMQDAFSRHVIGDFVSTYRSGRTPNPCIVCNDIVKFTLLLEYARAQGFGGLATGHYARIEREGSGTRFLLKTGTDSRKDQSYFLYRLTQDQMKDLVFPLGHLTKAAVRTIAREHRLPAAERPESQDICFVPDNDYRGFLAEQAPEVLRAGELVMMDGRVVGRHEGIALFTVGQRRQLGVSTGERLYVLRIDPTTNRVVLGNKAALQVRSMKVASPSYTLGEPFGDPRRVSVKVRYRSSIARATVAPAGPELLHVLFDEPITGVCPGQAAVFYEEDIVLGGGMISNEQERPACYR